MRIKRSIIIHSKEEEIIKKQLEGKNDPESIRLKKFLSMPDLSRTSQSPIRALVEDITAIEKFNNFDVIQVPEIVKASVSFDLFDFPKDHPARGRSDTYYLNNEYILRTHTTVMWYYWLGLEDIKGKIKRGESAGALSYGKVYRKDEIDRNHMNVFHQIDGWYLIPKKERKITSKDLQEVLIEIARAVFGDKVEYRFNKDKFPYTDPSLEMEVKVSQRWVEILGAGVVSRRVLKNFGVDPEKYNGWAFGFGLERLAIISMDLPDIRLLWSDDERVKRQLVLGNEYKEVSKFPPITRDVSFVVDRNFIPNDYFDLIRDIGGDLVEEVKLLDKYEDKLKFGKDKISYTYRIVYRSNERTLTTEEIDPLQQKIYSETGEKFSADLR